MSRLGDRWLWWRHAWFFDWAHKPLCEPYSEDVLKLGRLRLCRGCTALWAGALLLGPLIVGFSEAGFWGTSFFALLFVSATLSHPDLHSRWTRPAKDLLRLASGCLPTLAFAMILWGNPALGVLGLLLLAGVYRTYEQRRAARQLHKCESCPELGGGVCSGYELQAEAIRGWEEEASRREIARRLTAGE